MKVKLYRADQGACNFYRLAEPARIAKQEGVDAEVVRGVPLDPKAVMKNRNVPASCDDDVIVFQRPAKERTHELIEGFQRQGKIVVVDIDDDTSCLPSQHPGWGYFHGKRESEVHWRNMRRAAQLADLVTVTTPALAERFGREDRVVILPNCVPQVMLGMPSYSDGKTVGWAGAIMTHPGDLEATYGGVGAALEREPDWQFRILGQAEDIRQRLNLPRDATETGWLTQQQWHHKLGELDVGIVPLADTRFNEAKSWLKGIEYAARGVPFVASPLPEYEALAEEGVGTLAKPRARSWGRALLDLMRDESLRAECVERGKEVVAAGHTYETEGWRWSEAWQTALDRGRRTAVAA